MLSSGYAGTDKKTETPNNHLTEAKLESLTFKMKFKNNDIKLGETPEVIMNVVNTSDKKVERVFQLQVASAAKVSPMSRMASFPRKVWSKSIKIAMDPNQKKAVALKTDYKKKGKENLSISILADGKKLTPDLAVGATVLPLKLLKSQTVQAKAK